MKNVIVLLLVPLLSATEVRGAESPPFNYRPVTQADLERVRMDWASRDLSARQVKVIHEEDREGFKLLIVRHEVLSRAHFGAIFIPEVDDLSKAPVVVLPDHLEQDNPTIDIEINIRKFQSYEPLDGFIKILPAFRGRFMKYQEGGWFSRGDFCDAYDGPVDDSIAMLNVAEDLLPEVNFNKVLVWGTSRGSNTALLMAVRDPRVNTVITADGPVDFYRESWHVEGSNQYRCQFFDGKNEQESRERMLASSPLFFSPHENLEDVFLHHAAQDEIVPVWNTHEIAAHLESFPVSVTKYIYPVEGHGAIVGQESFWNNMKASISGFLKNIRD